MGALCCRPEEIDFDAEVDLWHFYLLRSVGKGAFGKVRVVQHKKTKELYALKYINKARISKQRAVNNIIQERRLLEEIDSPFVCNLRFAFQDDENLFMVLDLMLGGDLRFHLDRLGRLEEQVVRFYVAEMALALEDLHIKKIVHRDVKPDNILLDERGHAHLTDFNIAVHFSDRKPLTSVAGSMAYMAPEVLAKRGYFDTVDWWSLGVVAYELLFGRRPFRGKTNSSLTHAILKDPLKFPDGAEEKVSPQGLDCVRQLLQRDYRKRLGCPGTGGLAGFKRHPWFASLDWPTLEAKEAIPPFEPDSKKANFDATHELEELLLEDNPLKAKKRKQGVDLSQLSDDYQLMEQHFTNYDFLKSGRKTWFVSSESGDSASRRAVSTGVGATSTRGDAPISQQQQQQQQQAQPTSTIPMSNLRPGPSSNAQASTVPGGATNTRKLSINSLPVHPNAVKLEDQPLSEMTSKIYTPEVGLATSLSLSLSAGGGSNPASPVAPPSPSAREREPSAGLQGTTREERDGSTREGSFLDIPSPTRPTQ